MPADNSLKVLSSVDVNAEPIASDFVSGAHHQRFKVEWGADGAVNEVDDVFGKRLPVRTSHVTATLTATVTNGQTVQTTGSDLRGLNLIGIICPAEFDGTAITFQGSIDNTNFFPLYDATNSPVTIPMSPSRMYSVWSELYGVPYLKIVCGTAQSTSDTVFTLLLQG